MKIFALDTDMDRLKRRVISAQEREIVTVRFHPFLFIGKVLWEFVLTMVILGVAVWAWTLGAPLLLLSIAVVIAWLVFVFIPIIRAYIDWRFDGIVLTTEKVVIIDQKSIFRQIMQQMNLENIASVGTETQWLNLFKFGQLCFDLKEGTGAKVCFKYVPNADLVSAAISDAVTDFQRRRAYQLSHHGQMPPSPPPR